MVWFVLGLLACGEPMEGDPCATDEDCGDAMVCHVHGEDDEGVCETEDAHDTGG